MPRARNIKHGLFTNDDLAENDPLGRLLFIGLWTLADYKGELEWKTKRIKAQLLPYDECDVDALAINLDKSGFVTFYSDGAKMYCRVVNFEKHQNPHPNERKKGSDVPECTDAMRQLVDLEGLTINHDKSRPNQDKPVSNNADSRSLIPDSRSLKSDMSPQAGDLTTIFNYWCQRMGKGKQTKFSDKRKRTVQARLKEGRLVKDIKQAIDGCASSPFHMGLGPKSDGTVYNDLELICRNNEKLEQFMQLYEKPPGKQVALNGNSDNEYFKERAKEDPFL